MARARVNPNAILPAEVLTAIIVDCIVHNSDFASAPFATHVDYYLPDTALSISHVCRMWRGIALGTGGKKLWTHAPLRHNTTCIETFMQRSHPLPVFFKIEALMRDDVGLI